MPIILRSYLSNMRLPSQAENLPKPAATPSTTLTSTLRGYMRPLLVGMALLGPATESCKANEPVTIDAGHPLPEIDDPDETSEPSTTPPSPDAGEGIELMGLDERVGMGQTMRSMAQALRAAHPNGDLPAFFMNISGGGWQICGTATMPEATANRRTNAQKATNQAWWDQQRSGFTAAQCGIQNVSRELPIGFAMHREDTIGHIRHVARLGMRPTSRINRRTEIRADFVDAFRHTDLYQYLLSQSSELAEQFIGLVCDGIPAQETKYGSEITVSETGARGLWQMQPAAYQDAVQHRHHRDEVFPRNYVPNPDNYHDSSRLAALEFDNIYHLFRTTWRDENHPVWKYPAGFLIPALIGGYHNGGTRQVNLLNARLPQADMQEILRTENPDIIQDRAYITASTGYFLSGVDTRFGRTSVAYVPWIYTWHALFEDELPGDTNDTVTGVEPEIPTVGQARQRANQFMSALTSPTRGHIDICTIRSNPLSAVSIPRNQRSRTDWNFVTRAPSQNNIAVIRRLLARDRFAQRHGNGVATDAQLENVIAAEIRRRNLVPANAVQRPEIAYDSHNIPEVWRRVIRPDHVPLLRQLIVELNTVLYANGMSSEYLVVPVINSTIRSIQANNRLRGHSPNSAHLRFGATDFSKGQYVVLHKTATGYERYVDTRNTETFFRALIQASARMARTGQIAVRYHGPPQHFHVVFMSNGDTLHYETAPRGPQIRNGRPTAAPHTGTTVRRQPIVHRSIHRRPVRR
jgi:hypothetical protein